MSSSARRALLLMVLFVVLGAVLLQVTVMLRRPMHTSITSPRVLLFDVPSEVDEGPAPAALAFDLLREDHPTFHDLLFAVYNAAEDRSVEGLVLHIGSIDWGWARVHEMSAALRAFRASGKPLYACIDGAGEKEYVLAASAQRISMPGVSTLQLDGLSATAMFMAGGFDKLGVRPNFAHVGQYKSAVESYTRDSLSAPAREAMEALLDDEYTLLVDSLAVARHMSRERVIQLIDEGPYTAREAVEHGLVDTLFAQAEMDSLASHVGEERRRTGSFLRYVEEGGSDQGERIALLVAEGEIVDGKSREGALGGRSVGDETLIESLREIQSRKSIKAVVLRIDSPGGSGNASEAVWQEIRRLRRDKPVVVSMGDLAASGGYYLACAGDCIVASPSTITGSIGVFGGKFNLAGLYRKLGLNVQSVTRGRHADMMSAYTDFTPEEAGIFQRGLDQFYQVFLERVSEGRGLTVAQVDSVAQGRVWSGLAAQRLGLVDEFGGINEAVEIAREKAKIDEDADLLIEVYPRPRRTFVQNWVSRLFKDEDSDSDTQLAAVRELFAWYRASTVARRGAQALMPYSIHIE